MSGFLSIEENQPKETRTKLNPLYGFKYFKILRAVRSSYVFSKSCIGLKVRLWWIPKE
ncbi:MAG: hypothetical protein QXX60_07320 [Sulfolobales archaeon]